MSKSLLVVFVGEQGLKSSARTQLNEVCANATEVKQVEVKKSVVKIECVIFMAMKYTAKKIKSI